MQSPSIKTIWSELRDRWPKHDRTYILPTAKGTAFFLSIIVMVLTAATYNNNLIYIQAFFLFAILFVSLIQTHYNIKGLRLKLVSVGDAFESEALTLVFRIDQRYPKRKRAIRIRSGDKRWHNLASVNENFNEQEMERTVRLDILAARWGVHRLPKFYLESTFPLGLFRAWKIYRFDDEMITYPRPEGTELLVSISHNFGEVDFGFRGSPEGDFGELKNYQVGESYHQIAWKQFARRRELYTKVHWGEDHKHYSIPWQPARDLEKHLRQVSAWIKTAVDEDASFSLELPGAFLGVGAGHEHARNCWRALARMHPSSLRDERAG